MPTKFIREFYRFSKEVSFPEDPIEFTEYVTKNYVETNKCLKHREVILETDSVKKTISFWRTEEDFTEAFDDPKWVENKTYLENYASNNNIIIQSYFE